MLASITTHEISASDRASKKYRHTSGVKTITINIDDFTHTKSYFHQFFGCVLMWMAIIMSSPYIFRFRVYRVEKEKYKCGRMPKIPFRVKYPNSRPVSHEDLDTNTIVDDPEDVRLRAEKAGMVISYTGIPVLEIEVDNPFLDLHPTTTVTHEVGCDGKSALVCPQASPACEAADGPIEDLAEPKNCIDDICDYSEFVKDLEDENNSHFGFSFSDLAFVDNDVQQARIASQSLYPDAFAVNESFQSIPFDDSGYCTNRVPVTVRFHGRISHGGVVVDENVQRHLDADKIEHNSDNSHELPSSYSFHLNHYFVAEVSREFDQFLMDVEHDLELENATSGEQFHFSLVAYMAYQRLPYVLEVDEKDVSVIRQSHKSTHSDKAIVNVESKFIAPTVSVSVDDSEMCEIPSSFSRYFDQFFTREVLRNFENDMSELLADLSDEEESTVFN